MDLIIYHNACPDGFTAAYIAKLKYPEAKLLPRDHGLEPPYEEVTGKDVLVADFSWRTREQNDKLASLAKSFRILDHHKTAQAVLDGAEYAVFDMSRSGAGLAWDYLFGKDVKPEHIDGLPCVDKECDWQENTHFISYKEERPWWVDYVEDRDLWNHKLAETEAVNAYIMTTAYEIEAWRALTNVDLETAIDNGKMVRLEIEKYIREVIKQTQVGSLTTVNGTFSVGVVNVPYLHTSDIGHVLAQKYDIGMGWFERHDGMMQFSLRSIGDIDVSKIAQQFKGGGHMHASGFQLGLFRGREVIDTILGRI